MSLRAALARHLPDLATSQALLADLEAELDLALARQQLRRMTAAPRLLLAVQRAACTEVYEVDLPGVEWIDDPAPPPDPAGPPPLARVWEEELPNRLVRPLGAAGGLGIMLHHATLPAGQRTLVARLIGDE